MASEENVYCGGLKLYWTRMCESAEIYLVTQCREAVADVMRTESKGSYCAYTLGGHGSWCYAVE